MVSGVPQADRARHLVKRLARRVISVSAQILVSVVLHLDQVGVSAGYHQAVQNGGSSPRIFNIVGADISALDVVHPHQGDPCGKALCLCCGNTDQERAQLGRAVGHRDGIHFPLKRLASSRSDSLLIGDFFRMLSGSDLRHHAAVEGVGSDL